MSRTYNIWTIGCQMNEADSRHLGSQLEALGFSAVSSAEGADLVVLNTCVVRQQAEDRGVTRLKYVEQLKRRNPSMTIGLMGCMVGMREAPELKERFPFVDVFMPPSDTRPLMDHLGVTLALDEGRAHETHAKALRDALQDQEHILPATARGKSVQAHVPIVLGCSHACTFCVIPYRRGAERSIPPEQILNEISALTKQGVREVMLLGQIVDRYGTDFDHPYDLADLLHEVAKDPRLLRIRFLTGHPNYMSDRILQAVRDIPKVCPHLELPVQAGSDKVLNDMRRGYTRDDFRRLIERVRHFTPDAAINTDVIVGFPGESEQDFMDTYTLLDELQLDKVHLAKYSVRPKTIAARQMPDDVPEDEKERRRAVIDNLVEDIMARKNARFLNSNVEVLVEEKVKERYRGRTPDNRLVFFDDRRLPSEMLGAVVNVHVDWTGPYTLIGRGGTVVSPALAPIPSLTARPFPPTMASLQSTRRTAEFNVLRPLLPE
jgi:tRNA-2-methylthio-N6-dimethylallyladenosine synthase